MRIASHEVDLAWNRDGPAVIGVRRGNSQRQNAASRRTSLTLPEAVNLNDERRGKDKPWTNFMPQAWRRLWLFLYFLPVPRFFPAARAGGWLFIASLSLFVL